MMTSRERIAAARRRGYFRYDDRNVKNPDAVSAGNLYGENEDGEAWGHLDTEPAGEVAARYGRTFMACFGTPWQALWFHPPGLRGFLLTNDFDGAERYLDALEAKAAQLAAGETKESTP